MKQKCTILLGSLALVAATIFPATAITARAQTTTGTHPSGINARERRQQHSIRQGIRSGELTRREAGRLEAGQARINVDEAYARRSSGKLTTAERRRLQAELNRSNHAIYKQKHDEQERGEHPESINARQKEQQKRILQGERNGALTEREAKQIEAREAKISVNEAYARQSGGQFTSRERRRIQRELNHSNRAIYRQKHDKQTQH
ncbi:MAG: hypothetical protein ACR2LC_00380 [Pyrinomonadaceae bacterium]